ncbi:hypothetical protein ACTQV1_01085 [Paratractidigestivibacter faecalis]|uniref:hypothetical protein n=1 Tax=Paratractidigestivibacter faecalis TaxID=2292441 RepID=UPI003F998CA1
MLPLPIIDFYLTNSPYAHSDKGSSAQSIDLGEFGWEKRELDKLMKWVVKIHSPASTSNIRFSISKDVQETVDGLSLSLANPHVLGGAFCIQNSITATEDNSIKCRLKETYATCLFRHIRNSIAHGNYEMDDEHETVLFKDQASSIGTSNPRPTACFLTTLTLLEELENVIKGGPTGISAETISDTPGYRINHKLLGKTEEVES